MQIKNIVTDWSRVPVLFDVNFAVRLLGISEQSIRRFAANGIIPAKKVGKDWRFEKDAIYQYMTGKTRQE